MPDNPLNPQVMQHLIEVLQLEVNAIGKLSNTFVVERLNRGLADMRAQVGYDLAQVISAPNPIMAGEAAELAEKLAAARRKSPSDNG
jgi:hypothetical protein